MLKILAGVALSFLVWNPVQALERPTIGPVYFKMQEKVPDISAIPFIQNLKKNGGILHYMGTRSSLHGFLLVKQGQIQMLYVTPDKKSVFIGALFADDGNVVTTDQVKDLGARNKDVAAILDGSAQQSIDLIRAGVEEGGVAELPYNEASVMPTNKRLPLLRTSPGERLVMDLKASSGVLLGNTKAPELLMVVSPNCYHCKKTWDGLRQAVKSGKLQVRLIPIARNPKGDEIRIAAQLLRSKDPLSAWEAYVAGNKSALKGEPDKEAYRAIVANRVMTDRWNIMGTPYLVYRGQDKAIKIVQGRPERMAAVLADLVR